MKERTIWTIGHSTRPFADFVDLLKTVDIQRVVDVRRFPGSKRFPHYNKDLLASELLKHGIQYTHMEMLGGRRNPLIDSLNTTWKNKGFRGYADYMDTGSFKQGIINLENMASDERCVIMCTEAVWWSCHRSLISDYLKVNHWQVWHILGKNKLQLHPYTKVATVKEGVLSYHSPTGNQNQVPGTLF